MDDPSREQLKALADESVDESRRNVYAGRADNILKEKLASDRELVVALLEPFMRDALAKAMRDAELRRAKPYGKAEQALELSFSWCNKVDTDGMKPAAIAAMAARDMMSRMVIWRESGRLHIGVTDYDEIVGDIREDSFERLDEEHECADVRWEIGDVELPLFRSV